MLQRTNKLFIGKDINRTANVIAGIGMKHLTDTAHLADGEIVVLDKNLVTLAAGATIADTDVIYICQGLGTTFDYTPESGAAVTASRRVRLSDPIEGAKVRSFKGESYALATEQIDSWNLAGIVPVAGTEYFVRIVYKDMNEHPGQFTQTYRVIATTAVLATLTAALDAKMDAHSGCRIVATSTATTVVLTGRHIPECTTGLTDLEEYRLVEFESFINYVDSDGNWANLGAVLTRTPANYGSGMWEQVRDLENSSLPYRGVTNFTLFPVQKPAQETDITKTYDFIVIEHDKSYLSPDNQYVKQAPLTTVLAFVVPNAGAQEVDVLGQLNPWMASCPGSFAAVAV